MPGSSISEAETMATQYFGSYADGLVFKIESTFDEDTGQTTFKVTVLEGSLDMNAMFWSDRDETGGEGDLQGDWNTQTTKKGTVEADITDDGTMKFVGSDSALNMNGSGETWDGGVKLSNAGLAGDAKDTFSDNWALDDDDNPTYTFTAIGDLTDMLLGVRGTSTSTDDGSIKYVGSETPPEAPPPAADHFPAFTSNISHVDFYFDTDDNPATAEFIVRVNTTDAVNDDLDTWYQDLVDYVKGAADIVEDDAVLLGAAIKGGNNLNDGFKYYYALDNNTDADDPVNPGLVAGTIVDADPDYGTGNFGFGAAGLGSFPHEVLTYDGATFALA